MAEQAEKRSIEPHGARRREPETVKVSALLPKALLSKVDRRARKDRRSRSLMLVTLVERGLAADP